MAKKSNQINNALVISGPNGKLVRNVVRRRSITNSISRKINWNESEVESMPSRCLQRRLNRVLLLLLVFPCDDFEKSLADDKVSTAKVALLMSTRSRERSN